MIFIFKYCLIFFYFHDFFFEKKNFQGRGPARIPCGQRWGHPDILRPRQQVQVGEQEARWIARIHKWALQKVSLFFFPSKSVFFVFVITLSVSRGSEVSRLLIPFFEFLLPQTLLLIHFLPIRSRCDIGCSSRAMRLSFGRKTLPHYLLLRLCCPDFVIFLPVELPG